MVGLALLALFSTGLSQFLSCSWTAPTGDSFNLKSMYRNGAQGDYVGSDGLYLYYMNVCGACTIGGTCTSQGALLCQFNQTTGLYESMIASWVGSPRPTWSLINNANPSLGVDLLYQNGDICWGSVTGQPRTTNMTLFCDPHAPIVPTFQIWENPGDQCTYYVSYTSPGACPQGPPPERLVSGELVNNLVANNGWMYYSIDVGSSINELQVTTQQISSLGYVQLYVRLGALPTEQAYDRADLSYATKHFISIRSDDAPSDNPLQPGNTYYIGVKGISGDIQYTLQPFAYNCFNNCSGNGNCINDPNNGYYCQCNAGYQTNFDDCSAQVTDVVPGQDSVGTLVDEQWAYYRLQLTDTQSYQLFVEMDRASTDAGNALPTLMIKKNGWPTYTNNDGFIQDWWTPSKHWELEVVYPQLTTGTWIVAVVGDFDTTFQYSLRINVFDCDHGCSGHGTCNADTNTCECDDGYGDTDCSLLETPLNPGVPLTVTIPAYETSYFAIYVPTLLAEAHVDLLVEVTEDDPNFYPRLLLAPATMGVPTEAQNFIASPLPLRSDTQLRVPAYSLEQYENVSTWYLGVVSYAWQPIKITIAVTFEGYCPEDCAGHGVCIFNQSNMAVYCNCNSPWLGAACDVDPATLGSNEDKGVDDGLFAGLVILFVALAMIIGFGIKTKFPQCCQASRGEKLSSSQQQYSAISGDQ